MSRKSKKPARESVLLEAERLVVGDRAAAYNHPSVNWSRVGHIMGAVLQNWAKVAATKDVPVAVPARLACLCMQAVKISREVNGHRRDTCVDGAGYWECVNQIAERDEQP